MKAPAPLRAASFRQLWLAGLVTDSGDWLLFIALPVVVYDLTGSAFGTSLAFLVELVPGVLAAPLAGWFADRFDRRRLLFVVSILQALALLPLLAVDTRADLPVLYAVILAESVLVTVFDPAKNALLPTMVPRRDLVAANSLIGLNQNLGRLIGGPLGGILLAVGGLDLVAVIDLVSYLLAAALIARLAPTGARELRADEATSRSSYRATLRLRRVRGTLLVTFTGQIAQGIFVVLFVVFVADRLHGGSSEVGLLRGVQAIGAIVGGLALGMMSRRHSAGALAGWGAAAFGVLGMLMWNGPALTTALPVYITLFILVGAPGIVMATGLLSTIQDAAADHLRGRAFSAYSLAANLGQIVGMLTAGGLVAPLGLTVVLDAQATLYLLAGLFAALFMRAARLPAVHGDIDAVDAVRPHSEIS